MSATSHEAPYVLDGLLHHGTRCASARIYVDTGGASDHVFILCAMLGDPVLPAAARFARPQTRLHRGGHPPMATCSPIIGRRIKEDVIREHWGEILRLVASLQAGTVAPSVMLKSLAAYRRQNQLDLALQELGRIERTLFILDWLESPATATALPRRAEQERAASCSGPGDLHLQAGPHR